MKFVSLAFLMLFIMNCSEKPKRLKIIPNKPLITANQKKVFGDSLLPSWPIKDIAIDTIPGISLERAYDSLLTDKQGDTVTVAIIDMSMEINHPEIRNHLWVNRGEIPNNSLDDDGNGYVDDANGWNFLGNGNGDNIAFTSYEYTRIIKKHRSVYDSLGGKAPDHKAQVYNYRDYLKAKKAYDEKKVSVERQFRSMDSLREKYFANKHLIRSKTQKDTFDIEQLHQWETEFSNDSEMLAAVNDFKLYFSKNINDRLIAADMLMVSKKVEVMLALDYKDGQATGDNKNDILDNAYGNPNVNHNLHLMDHGTKMTGVVLSSFQSKKLDKIMGSIKIMPLCVSGFGDEHDKDIALAIRYAVDNGAQVINISSGKYHSLYPEWVKDAIVYAAQNNVLIVASSGNTGLDLDLADNIKYPSDIDSKGVEISQNFIRVGASNYVLDSTFVHPATNIGKTEVDIFAPGEHIRTTSAKENGYTLSYGTSASAAMVSKVAALVLSYHPTLEVSDLKQLLLGSAVQYPVSVRRKTDHEIFENLPFGSLSRTGGVINAYNALLLAEKTN